MNGNPRGELIIIGGHENKDGARTILEEVARRARGHLAIVTVASQEPEEMAQEYVELFHKLRVKTIEVLDIRTREQAWDNQNIEKVRGARCIFFTGGDQLRITSEIGDSPTYRCILDRYMKGATIAGTSAGAAVMPETMLISGPSDESNKVSAMNMAPGLGLINEVVIDSHFAQRGRMGRLLGAVAQNPKNLGIGIDEDTAIIVQPGRKFRIIGSGAVYVVDGSNVTYSSLSEDQPEGVVSIYNVKLHVLGEQDIFDLAERRPLLSPKEEQEIKGKKAS